MQNDKFVNGVLKSIAVFVFIIVSLPGILSLYTFLPTVLHSMSDSNDLLPEATKFQTTLLDVVIPKITNIPANIATLIIAAVPILIARVIYKNEADTSLTLLGKVSIMILFCGFILNFFGGFIVDPTNEDLIRNFADQAILSKFKALIDKTTYFCLFYALIFLNLRPKQ